MRRPARWEQRVELIRQAVAHRWEHIASSTHCTVAAARHRTAMQGPADCVPRPPRQPAAQHRWGNWGPTLPGSELPLSEPLRAREAREAMQRRPAHASALSVAALRDALAEDYGDDEVEERGGARAQRPASVEPFAAAAALAARGAAGRGAESQISGSSASSGAMVAGSHDELAFGVPVAAVRARSDNRNTPPERALINQPAPLLSPTSASSLQRRRVRLGGDRGGDGDVYIGSTLRARRAPHAPARLGTPASPAASFAATTVSAAGADGGARASRNSAYDAEPASAVLLPSPRCGPVATHAQRRERQHASPAVQLDNSARGMRASTPHSALLGTAAGALATPARAFARLPPEPPMSVNAALVGRGLPPSPPATPPERRDASGGEALLERAAAAAAAATAAVAATRHAAPSPAPSW